MPKWRRGSTEQRGVAESRMGDDLVVLSLYCKTLGQSKN